MSKVSFIGTSTAPGRKAFPVVVTDRVYRGENSQDETVTIWIAPLSGIDHSRAIDESQDLVRDWIGGALGEEPRAPLTELFGKEGPPVSLCGDIALLIITQRVAKPLVAGGHVDLSWLEGESPECPEWVEYNAIELAYMAVSGHLAFDQAIVQARRICTTWEGEKRANPIDSSAT